VQTDGCGVPRGTGRTVAPVTPSHTLPKTTGPTTTTPSRGNPRNSGNATTGKEAKPYWVQAKIVGATDGDTVTVLVSGNKQYRVRLNGVDAPESDQPYGADAKKALSALVLGKIVKLKVYGQDRSRRYWADVYVGQIWVNHELVRKGCAWYYKRNFSSKDLDKAESDAKLESVGLWQDEHPIAPWDWRKGTRPEE
jgi:endonuclease YncB( thermonuclease family)